MLKSRTLCLHTHRRCLSYFSNVFNHLANQSPTKAPSGMQSLNDGPASGSNLDLDIFVNQDHRQMDLLDKLLRLRKQRECTTVPLLPNLLVKQLMEYTVPQEAITVLRSPLQYGIFIDQFTGCHLIDVLLHNGNAREAAQVSALLIERNLCTNELVSALALKSFFTYLKDYQPTAAGKVDQSEEVEKVRVKFLRNYSKKDNVKTEENIIGDAILKLVATISSRSDSLKKAAENLSLLGLVFSGSIAKAEKSLAKNRSIFYEGILQICPKLITGEHSEFAKLLDQALKECSQTNSFDQILDSHVKAFTGSLEPQIISEYTKAYQEWEAKYQEAVNKQIKLHEIRNRVETIENTLDALKTMRQNLWFFENKEDIDIDIYKKKVYYPKRWFGKKKKPKAVDAFYVPPNISRAH